MYIICCHCKYSSRATRLSSAETLEEARAKVKQSRKVYRHVTATDVDTKKIAVQRLERSCCKVSEIIFHDGSAL